VYALHFLLNPEAARPYVEGNSNYIQLIRSMGDRNNKAGSNSTNYSAVEAIATAQNTGAKPRPNEILKAELTAKYQNHVRVEV
jgi:hypothetical protein